MLFVVVICLVLGLVAGVTEGQRIINAVDTAAATLHTRIAALEERLKEKL